MVQLPFCRPRMTVHGIRGIFEWKSWSLFYDSDIYLAVQLEELGKMAINFSRYSWNTELEFKAGIYGIRVGTIPNCSGLKSNLKDVLYQEKIQGFSGIWPLTLKKSAQSEPLRNSCTSTLKPLERIKGKNNILLSRAIARQQVINPHNLLQTGSANCEAQQRKV